MNYTVMQGLISVQQDPHFLREFSDQGLNDIHAKVRDLKSEIKGVLAWFTMNSYVDCKIETEGSDYSILWYIEKGSR